MNKTGSLVTCKTIKNVFNFPTLPYPFSLYPSPIKRNSSLTYLVPALIDNWFKKQKTTVIMKINKIEKQIFLWTNIICQYIFHTTDTTQYIVIIENRCQKRTRRHQLPLICRITEQNRTGNGLFSLGRNWAKIEPFLGTDTDTKRAQSDPKVSKMNFPPQKTPH